MTNEEVERVLRKAEFAKFCSLNADGTIHAAPVWFKYEDGRILVSTPSASRKARNVKRNMRVTILIDTTGPKLEDFQGVIVYGKADMSVLTQERLPELVSLCEKYMPRERAEGYARDLLKLTKMVMISVKPDQTASFDYGKDVAFRAVGQSVQTQP